MTRKKAASRPPSRESYYRVTWESLRLRVSELRAKLDVVCESRLAASGGCRQCRGHGSFAYRDTLDYLVPEQIPCGCSGETRELSQRICAEVYAHPEYQRLSAEAAEAYRAYVELRDLKPCAGAVVRVVSGRKVPYGVYQVVWAGRTQFGERVGLGEAGFTDAKNCVVCVTCKACSTTDVPDSLAWCPLTGLCGPCRDRAEEKGGVG